MKTMLPKSARPRKNETRKKFTSKYFSASFPVFTAIFISAFSSYTLAQSVPSLGAAQSFAALAGTTITATGLAVVSGNLGVSPGVAVTGFPPAIMQNGQIYTGAGSLAGPAQSSAFIAYNDLKGQACSPANNLSGLVLGESPGCINLNPGVYCFNTSAQLNATLTLNDGGDPNAIFIFQVGSTLTTASNSQVLMSSGGRGTNVYWQIGSSATMGTFTNFRGNIIANTSITFTTAASTTGKVFAINGAATLDANFINALPFKTWDAGAGTSNWNDPVNWDTDGVPVASEDVMIPTGKSIYPILITTNAVNGLTIQNGGSLTVTGGTLQIGESINNSGIFDLTGGTIEMNGSSPQTIPANAFVNNSIRNLVINNNVTLAGQDTLTGVLSVGNNKTFATGGFLVLKSTATSTARIAPFEADGAGTAIGFITGNVEVEKFIPNRRAWRLLTAPLSNTGAIYNSWQNGGVHQVGSGMFITGPNPEIANGLDASAQNKTSMQSYNVATQAFLDIKNTKTTNLSNNTGSADNVGYFVFVRGDRNPNNLHVPYTNNTTLRSAGKLQTGKQTFTASATSNNFTIMGNPYASSVDFNNVQRSHLIKRFYVWDATLNNYGAFVVLDDLDGDGNFSKSIPFSLQDKNIQSGEAFFVQTDTAGLATLTYFESSKSSETSNASFRPLGQQKLMGITINLVEAGNSIYTADAVLVEFNDNFSPGVNLQDAVKFTNINETLSLQRNGSPLAIERRPVITTKDTLFLRLVRSTQRNYQIVLNANNLDQPNLLAFLEDRYTGIVTSVKLDGNTTVNFTVNSSTASSNMDRFSIVFRQSGLLPVTYTNVKAWQQDNSIAVKWTVENELNIQRYVVEKSIDGKNFTEVNTRTVTFVRNTTGTYNWLDIHPVSGNNYYRIGSFNRDGTFAYSKMVKVIIRKSSGEIIVYSNAAANGVISLQFYNMQQGQYNIRVTNTVGQVLSIEDIYHAGGSTTKKITLSKGLAPGIYNLEITNPDNGKTIISIANQ